MSRFAVIQMVSSDSIKANLAQAAELLGEAARRGAEFALLPEFFPMMSDDETAKVRIGEAPGAGPVQDFLAEQASVHRLWLMAGTCSLHSAESERVYNACLLYNPEGLCTHRYDKMHLFDVQVEAEEQAVYNESNTIAPGRTSVVADTPLGRVGMTVCYDLRFPELYRELSSRQAEIFTVPAAFTYATGKRHWELLLRARAVENLCYVVAANQGGQNTQTRRTWGHSMIVAPWGDMLCSLEEGPGVACADIDLAGMHELRRSFPALTHRVIAKPPDTGALP
ncbi:MAG: carbon-nitrogen hydrolase family protein [Gammaproteobacteria bacterium]|nr:carbon-nitrogen hydrolase family protein [Gammaproteobacteria bacterium]